MRLKNKVAVITGAGRGIGFAAARAFVREGARVVIAEIDEALGKSAESVLREGPGRAAGEAVFIKTDCSDSADVRSLMARAEELYGGLHVLYNNASIFLKGADGPVTDLAEDIWDKVLAANLRSVYLCCKYGLPLMVRSGGGAIINTASSAGLMGVPGCDAYTAAKGGTISLTRSLSVEYGPRGIRSNCICPAGVETEMVRASSLDDPNFDAAYFFKRAPLGRLGRPEEVAELAVFLASDESSYINGAVVRADGGITVTPIS